ncbi:MAG: hypothetical protein Q8O76_10630 [Chloroflexota bacterium]|nr:hypothetical protein [Chloroflexota bacterium]
MVTWIAPRRASGTKCAWTEVQAHLVPGLGQTGHPEAARDTLEEVDRSLGDMEPAGGARSGQKPAQV